MRLKATYEWWLTFAESRSGRRLVRVIRMVFISAVVGLLAYQLSRIGWLDIWNSLPTQPLFYVLLLAMYFLLPVTESLIYGRLWGIRARDCLPVMIRKRVLNVDVVGYSGEVYLFTWAKDRVAAGRRNIMATIKDNLILTSATSIIAASILLAALLAGGLIHISDFVDNPNPIYIGIGAFLAGLLVALAYRFRRVIFSLPKRTVIWIGGAHLTRFFLGYVLLITHWWVVIPSASFETWAILLTVSVLINRVPFLPSSDLVFVSAGAGLTPLLDIPVAPVVSMLLVRSAVDRLLNLVLFTTTVWRERQPVFTGEDSGDRLDESDTADRDESPSEIAASLNT